ncbi:MAG: phosphoglycerate dehydrogenase, partial [Patescibacteria group bacterium]
ALQSGEIAGYAADVLADELSFEKTFSTHPLIEYARKNKNVIIVPHIGGMTVESRSRTDVFIAEKLKKFISKGMSL